MSGRRSAGNRRSVGFGWKGTALNPFNKKMDSLELKNTPSHLPHIKNDMGEEKNEACS